MKQVRLVDTTLRDGMHAVSHQLTADQMAAIAQKLDEAGVGTIEIGQGDGIGGSSRQYGFARETDEAYFKAVSRVLTKAKWCALLIPGIGTIDDLKVALEYNVGTVRVATHVTEADVSEQHIKFAKQAGIEAIGFLMMSHMAPVEKVVEQAKLMAGYGADIVYVTDSAGAMTPDEVKARISAVKNAVNLPIGFHAHNNLGLAIGNTLAALEEGASLVDGTIRGLGAGAGNPQLEVLTGVLQRKGIATGLDFYGLIDASEQVVDPVMMRPQVVDGGSLMLGYAGVYSSFLLHVYTAAQKFSLEPRDILVELGKRKMVGGQEDLIIDVAYNLKQAKGY